MKKRLIVWYAVVALVIGAFIEIGNRYNAWENF